jgi:hypothetical protein
MTVIVRQMTLGGQRRPVDGSVDAATRRCLGLLDDRLRRIFGAGLDSFLSPLTEDLPSVGLVRQRSRLAHPCQSAAEISRREAGFHQPCRQGGEKASPDAGDSREKVIGAGR